MLPQASPFGLNGLPAHPLIMPHLCPARPLGCGLEPKTSRICKHFSFRKSPMTGRGVMLQNIQPIAERFARRSFDLKSLWPMGCWGLGAGELPLSEGQARILKTAKSEFEKTTRRLLLYLSRKGRQNASSRPGGPATTYAAWIPRK